VSLNTVGLLERVVVLVPHDLGLGHAKDVALDLAAVDSDQVDLGRGLDELWIENSNSCLLFSLNMEGCQNIFNQFHEHFTVAFSPIFFRQKITKAIL